MLDQAALYGVLAQARDYAVIVLGVLGLAVGIGVIVALVPALRGLRQVRRRLPWYMHRVQTASSTARRGVEQAMGVVVLPFVWLGQLGPQSRALSERFRARLGSVMSRGR